MGATLSDILGADRYPALATCADADALVLDFLGTRRGGGDPWAPEKLAVFTTRRCRASPPTVAEQPHMSPPGPELAVAGLRANSRIRRDHRRSGLTGDLSLARVRSGRAGTGVVVLSEKIMERLVRAACRDFREGCLIKVASRLSAETFKMFANCSERGPNMQLRAS